MPTVIIGQSGEGNVIGNVRNAAGGLAVVNSGLRNDVAAYYPDIGIAPAYTIWVSGSVFTAINNTNGQILASGTNGANVFDTVMTLAQGTTKGYVHVKAGDYNFTSGWGVGAATKLVGAGDRCNFNFNASSGRISGAIMVVASASRLRDFNIIVDSGVMCGLLIHPNTGGIDAQNIGIYGPDSTLSGTRGISIEGSQQNEFRNIDIHTFSVGIRMISGTGGTPNTWEAMMEGIRIGSVQTGMLLDNVYDNIIDNVHIDEPASGGIILTNSARRNTISNIHSNSTTIPAVVIMTSGGNNSITSVVNASGGPTIVNSGNTSTNKIGAYFNEAGIINPAHYSIWVSGSNYNAIRATDGVTLFSGTNLAECFRTVISDNMTNEIRGGIITVKPGTYSLTSGVAISGDYMNTIQGEGKSTYIVVSGHTGRISGAFLIHAAGTVIRDMGIDISSGVMNLFVMPSGPDVNDCLIENIGSNGPGSDQSGTHVVLIDEGFDNRIRNITADSYDEALRLNTTNGFTLENFVLYSMNTGIFLNDAGRNFINNIYLEPHTSGVVILQGINCRQNILDGIEGALSGGSIVVVQTSGERNRITNVVNRNTNGIGIADLTSGQRNLMLPGSLDPTVLISGSSPFTYVNASGRQEMITVGGGTVSLIEFVRRGTTTALSGLTAGTFILNGGDKLTVTYSAAPAIKVIPTG